MRRGGFIRWTEGVPVARSTLPILRGFILRLPDPMTMRSLSRWLSLLLCCTVLALSGCGPGEEDDGEGGPVESAPVITVQPASVQSDGSAVDLRVAATGGGLSYQWYRDNAAIAQATSASLSTSTAGAYHVVVRNSLGEVRSATAQVTVSVDPVIVVQPASASVTTGGGARFTVVATGEGLSYQWYRDGAAISGATGASLQTDVAAGYTVVVSSSREGARSVTSASAVLTVSQAQAPVIVQGPVAQSVVAGRLAWFTVTATGTDLRYTWYRDGVQIAGASERAYVLQPAASVNQGAYHVVVRNAEGTASSVPVQLTVLPVGDGSNTALVVSAAREFLDTLSAAQKSTATTPGATGTAVFAATLANARGWSVQSGLHQGLRLDAALSARQLAAADRLIAAALSASGATMVSEIRLSDGVYAQLRGDDAAGTDRYSIAIFGTPSASGAWALQISGHQLVHNLSYNTPQIGATPMFIGARPPHWAVNSAGVTVTDNTATTSGTPHAALEAQRAAAAALATALRSDATIAAAARLTLPQTELLMAPVASSDTAYRSVPYPGGTSGRGVRVSALDAAQRAAVKAVVEAWVKTQAADVAQALLAAYLADDALDATYVAYGNGVGGSPDFDPYPNAKALPGNAANSYIRIDGPRAWIEFLVRPEGGVGAAPSTQVYYSGVWRDKLADYGARY